MSGPTTTHDFQGRSVIVTGAGRGVGLEIARLFAGAGANTFLVDVDRDVVEAAAAEVGGHALTASVAETADVNQAVATVVEHTGRVDVLVNNAGVLRDKVLWKLTDEDWDFVLDVHLGGTFKFTRACVPQFRSQQSGRVINVTSYAGLRGMVGQTNYSSAKAGIIGFTKAAARELGRFGITVNAISPNAETRMVASIPRDKYDAITDMTPLGRFGEPHEMAGAVAYLASDEAAYVTGVVIRVDGGLGI